jgi:hypothetical protein
MPGETADANKPRRARVQVIHDDEDLRLLVRLSLRRDPRLEVVTGGDGEVAWVDVVIVDQYLRSGRRGEDVAVEIKASCGDCKVLLLVGHEPRGPRPWPPAVDAALRKDEIGDLLPVVQKLVGLSPELDLG